MNHKQKKGKGMTLEQNIRELRKIYGLSQEQVADAMDINRSTLVAVEKGDRDLNSEELGKLADYLGIDITELVAQEVPDYEKYEQMILEVVDEYVKQTEGKSLPKTFLAKLLYLTDFSWFYDELKANERYEISQNRIWSSPRSIFSSVRRDGRSRKTINRRIK
jgi:transcriptional regulator with XRE-family HTH domain